MDYFWRVLTYAALAYFVWRAVLEFRGWRYGKNLRLRRLTWDYSNEFVLGSATVDFIEMQVFSESTLLEYSENADWPQLYVLRRLDGPRWEFRVHSLYHQHRIDELRKRLKFKVLYDREDFEAELKTLLSGNPAWEEWHGGSQAEPAYQLFLRSYRPTDPDDDARFKLSTLEERYQRRWQSEADKLAKREAEKPASDAKVEKMVAEALEGIRAKSSSGGS